MSSRAEASARMSSRSIGVTNVWLSRSMMSCVMRSPSCSRSRISGPAACCPDSRRAARAGAPTRASCWPPPPRTTRSRPGPEGRTLARSVACRRDASGSSATFRFGALDRCRALHRRGPGAPPRPGRRGSAPARRHRSSSSAPGRETPVADLGGVFGDPGDHMGPDVREALDEPGHVAVIDAEQVVEHQDLAVGRPPGADPDHRDSHGHHLGRDRGRDRLQHDREASRLLQRDGVAGHASA